jgi:hypothetical protein
MALFQPIGGPTGTSPSGFSSGEYAGVDATTQQQLQGINQTTGTKTPTTLNQTMVQPVSGQTNDTPDSNPNSLAFNIDSYRNGDKSSSDPEQYNPLTLASWDTEKIASLSLRAYSSTSGSTNYSGNTTDIISMYSRFILQGVSEAEQEKYQVVETFTSYYIFFFGKRPPIYRYSGTLLSDPNYRWNNDFKYVYENFFRGTSATEFSAEVIMSYDGRVITGFPVSLVMNQEAANDKGMPFTMDLLVVSHTPMAFSRDIASLLSQAQAQLAALKNAIGGAAAQTVAITTGPAQVATDRASNNVTPPSAFSVPGAPSTASPISQIGNIA